MLYISRACIDWNDLTIREMKNLPRGLALDTNMPAKSK